MNLPEKFEKRMQEPLGGEYEAFLNCYNDERKQGLRVNTGKISVDDFLKITPFTLTPIPWTDNGFFYREEDEVTKHPHYYAGLYYIQEPSAMVPASRLPVEPGDRVLDLCAAPGGKATELGARLKGKGLLVANDVSVSRARGLLKNLELFGISNAFVTGETPGQLLENFEAYFDKILVDAPCSGEGMFRKDPSLVKSWMERGPEYYAPLQKEILSCAVQMLRPGGMLLYSTCTFAVEEDEMVIQEILDRYPEMELAECLGFEGFSPGLLKADPGKEENRRSDDRWENEKCIRIWPHKMDGEGHFTVLLRKAEGKDPQDRGLAVWEMLIRSEKYQGYEKAELWETEKQSAGKVRKEKKARTLQKTQNTRKSPGEIPEEAEDFLGRLSFPQLNGGRIFRNRDSLFWIPEEFMPPKLRYLRTGLHLGEIKKERFEPSQALAMALRRDSFGNVLDLPSDHPAVKRYLRGETLELPKPEGCPAGWVLVCCDGFPLGWGKCVNGTLRNKYRTGWRMQ